MKRSIVAVSALAVLAAACSPQPAEQAAEQPAEQPAAAKSTARLGEQLDLTRADGSTIAVTLVQVINPATVAHGRGEAGKTYVATELKLTDTGTTAIEGDVNVNVSVIGSDKQSYSADLNDVTECPNFDMGTFHLEAGKSATGCVVFALPHGVTPVTVQYRPSAGFAGDSGEWQVS